MGACNSRQYLDPNGDPIHHITYKQGPRDTYKSPSGHRRPVEDDTSHGGDVGGGKELRNARDSADGNTPPGNTNASTTSPKNPGTHATPSTQPAIGLAASTMGSVNYSASVSLVSETMPTQHFFGDADHDGTMEDDVSALSVRSEDFAGGRHHSHHTQSPRAPTTKEGSNLLPTYDSEVASASEDGDSFRGHGEAAALLPDLLPEQGAEQPSFTSSYHVEGSRAVTASFAAPPPAAQEDQGDQEDRKDGQRQSSSSHKHSIKKSLKKSLKKHSLSRKSHKSEKTESSPTSVEETPTEGTPMQQETTAQARNNSGASSEVPETEAEAAVSALAAVAREANVSAAAMNAGVAFSSSTKKQEEEVEEEEEELGLARADTVPTLRPTTRVARQWAVHDSLHANHARPSFREKMVNNFHSSKGRRISEEDHVGVGVVDGSGSISSAEDGEEEKKEVEDRGIGADHDVVRGARSSSPSSPAERAELEKGLRRSMAAMNKSAKAYRLKNIHASPLEGFSAEYTPLSHPKSGGEAAFLRRAIGGNFVFDHLSPDETEDLVGAFDKMSAEQDERIIVEGSVGDYFYVVARGEVTFYEGGEEVGVGKAGTSFGELALLYNCPRTATCVSSSNGGCELWRVDQETFRRMLARTAVKKDDYVTTMLKTLPFLAKLSDVDLVRIADAMTEITYEAGEVIAKKGTVGNTFYLIREGSVLVHDIEVGNVRFHDVFLETGKYFGERSMFDSARRVATVTAQEETTLLCLNQDDFHALLGDLESLTNRTEDRRRLTAISILHRPGIHDYEISALVDLIEDMIYPEGADFFTAGEAVTPQSLALFFVRKGIAFVKDKKGKVHKITKGGFFGADNISAYCDQSASASSSGAAVVASTTVTAGEDCHVGMLTLDSFESVLGSLERLDTLHGRASFVNSDRPKQLDDSKMKLRDLTKHKILGVGTFGKVWLVSKKDDAAAEKETFALKMQNKRNIMDMNRADLALRERNVMASLDSPFVVKLVKTFHDDRFVYMLLSVVQGGELFSVIYTKNGNGVSERTARFYSAGILEGLSHMHSRNVIYRDMKPENVLLDEKGFPVIIDLGFAKRVVGKTYTLCGTPQYLAPEVILSRGHGMGADYWSWGILIFEMFFGITPFTDFGTDQIALFRRICRGKFVFPGDLMSTAARDLVKKLIVVQPTSRLGCLAGGCDDIRRHEWFEGFDFAELRSKELEAPWLPRLVDPLDVSHFENWDHLDAPPDERERPLTEKEQKLFKNF